MGQVPVDFHPHPNFSHLPFNMHLRSVRAEGGGRGMAPSAKCQALSCLPVFETARVQFF